MNVSAAISISDEVRDALSEGRAVVALETAVLTHGLPRTPLGSAPRLVEDPLETVRRARLDCWSLEDAPYRWDSEQPVNLEVARLVEATVRSRGGVPATIAVIDGTLRIGLDEAALVRLAAMEDVTKCSTRELGMVMARGGSGGTTVAGTLAAARAANRQLEASGLPRLEVFATGGIGGVHRGAERSFDVSADLTELGRTPLCVVCAGVKSILDIGLTLEYLETQGVAVATLGPPGVAFPSFFTPASAFDSPTSLPDVETAAA